jgi:hypothetical protein
MKLFNSIRASMLLGKGHKFLEKGRYREALGKALQAKNLQLEEQFEWLCCSIEGKSRYHLGDSENALPALRRAAEILAAKPGAEKESRHFQNIASDINSYIAKIEGNGE